MCVKRYSLVGQAGYLCLQLLMMNLQLDKVRGILETLAVAFQVAFLPQLVHLFHGSSQENPRLKEPPVSHGGGNF